MGEEKIYWIYNMLRIVERSFVVVVIEFSLEYGEIHDNQLCSVVAIELEIVALNFEPKSRLKKEQNKFAQHAIWHLYESCSKMKIIIPLNWANSVVLT